MIEAAYPGVGLSNPDLKWRAAYTSQINKHHPDLVIMMLGGWDLGYVEAQGASAYSSIVDEAVNILTADGAHLLWLSMLPGGTTPQRSVDRIYEQLPERFFGKVGYADIEGISACRRGRPPSETMAGAELCRVPMSIPPGRRYYYVNRITGACAPPCTAAGYCYQPGRCRARLGPPFAPPRMGTGQLARRRAAMIPKAHAYLNDWRDTRTWRNSRRKVARWAHALKASCSNLPKSRVFHTPQETPAHRATPGPER